VRKGIVIGSRGSKLAQIQAESVLDKLQELNPELEFTLDTIVTRGDREHKVPMDRMAGVGVFVKELEEALLDGRIDLAIHSLKDMPTEIPNRLSLAAVVERLDPRDVLVSKTTRLSELAPGSRVGTASLRRAIQVLSYRPDLEICSIRGNIDTRLRKVSSGELDSVILAAAAMIRLGYEERITEYLSPEHFLPSVGQGALGIEIRSGDEHIAELVSVLNHHPTQCSVIAERAFLRALGGGCRAPIAALGTPSSDTLRLDGMVAGTTGQSIIKSSEEGNISGPEQVGIRLAQKILAMGASQLIREAKVQ
jgi:hydroxymethylbilane synthase